MGTLGTGQGSGAPVCVVDVGGAAAAGEEFHRVLFALELT
jgi:hypothetical protein